MWSRLKLDVIATAERTEDNLQGEALANKDESQRALRYAAQMIGELSIVRTFGKNAALDIGAATRVT